MELNFQTDIERVHRLPAVPTILEVVCRTTGMRFAAIARVTDARWIACSVLDEIDFGLRPGGELKVETTICHDIRQSLEPVVIDDVATDEYWSQHPIPTKYKFQSFISVPILLEDGSFFGTLCALDPLPARVKTAETLGMFRLFAQLIARSLDAGRKQAETESALNEQRAEAELREQFMAVLGHDLRTPLRSIKCLAQLLVKSPLEQRDATMAQMVLASATRMQLLIDNLLDLARGRLFGGLYVSSDSKDQLEPTLRAIIEELRASYPDQKVKTDFRLVAPVHCDHSRIAQLFSNLLANALLYGASDQPVCVRAISGTDAFELSVSNSGTPIPPSVMENLFQPFHRRSVLKNREGLGLGLYIAHEIAAAHGGTLKVESTAEKTCFSLHVPVVTAVTGQPEGQSYRGYAASQAV